MNIGKFFRQLMCKHNSELSSFIRGQSTTFECVLCGKRHTVPWANGYTHPIRPRIDYSHRNTDK